MPTAFAVKFATPLTTLFEGEAQSLRLPAADGRMGVLAGHAPMVAELVIGEVIITDSAGERHYFASTRGVARVEAEGVAVVAETAEPADAIDVERAHRALARARERLSAELKIADVDVTRAQLALARALNRLKVAEHIGRS